MSENVNPLYRLFKHHYPDKSVTQRELDVWAFKYIIKLWTVIVHVGKDHICTEEFAKEYREASRSPT